MRLLVVEDEVDLIGALRGALQRAGYAVDIAQTGEDALHKASSTMYDLVLLDLNLPDMDGYDVAHEVRRQRRDDGGPRILMLTARGGIADRVRGLDVGADDYLVKPFALAELHARIRALLRRDTGVTGVVLSVGDVTLDVARHEVHRAEREVSLTRKEFGVLHYLMSRPGHVVSSEELLEHVWDENADPFTNTVRVTVGTLRRKLGAVAPNQPIETVIGRGYRLREEA